MDPTDRKRMHELHGLGSLGDLIMAITKLFPQQTKIEKSAQMYLEEILTSCSPDFEKAVLTGAYKNCQDAEATEPTEAQPACLSPKVPEQTLPIIKNAAATGPQSEQDQVKHPRYDDCTTESEPVEERLSGGSSHKRGLDHLPAYDEPAGKQTKQTKQKQIIAELSTDINPGDSERAKARKVSNSFSPL
ncbi:hypothetical protein BJX63DRAFT_139742 [Aspergillus granulosus]|uniref:Uncharacterized protein n=1 Tax=Aspergillus granulosus TaxID=176169 RepID=A0ABR4GSG0_9EURO